MGCTSILSAAGLALTLASGEPVHFATEAPFSPYSYVDEVGKVMGFEREVGDEVCHRAGLVCDWQNVQFDRLLPGVMSGEFDVVLGGLAITPARMRMVDFSRAYNQSNEIDVLYGMKNAPAPEIARIAVQSGTIQADHARTKGWTTLPFATPTDSLAAVATGRADLAFGAFGAEVADFSDLGPQYNEEVPDLGTAMAVCRGNTGLLTQLNDALNAMTRDGTIDAIAERWL